MSNIKSLLELYEKNHRALVWNPMDQMVYIDNPTVDLSKVDERYYESLTPVMDAQAWNASRSKSASNDASSLADVFVGEFANLAVDMFSKYQAAYVMHKNNPRDPASKSAAIITSQDYSILQQAVVIGETMDEIKTGVLAQAIPELNVPTLKGEYLDWAAGVEYFTNVPEGAAVEPTKGTVTSVEYTVPKGMGGVAITERAQAVIQEANVFQKNISELQRQRLKKENAMVAAELENATTVTAGVDFGLRAGVPPLSSNTPEALFLTLTDAFDALGGNFNAIMSKNQAYNEAINNDYLKGFYQPNAVTPLNEASAPAPGLSGVTWYRDNAILSATKLWALDLTRSIKGLRSAVRSFQIENLKEENTEYYIKSYYLPKIVDQGFIQEVTGVTA